MTNGDKYLKDGVSEYDFLNFVFNEGNISWDAEGDYCYIKKLDLLHLLQQPLKPTLTEDEKVILKRINKDFLTIRRGANSKVLQLWGSDTGYVGIDIFDKGLFSWIQPRRRTYY